MGQRDHSAEEPLSRPAWGSSPKPGSKAGPKTRPKGPRGVQTPDAGGATRSGAIGAAPPNAPLGAPPNRESKNAPVPISVRPRTSRTPKAPKNSAAGRAMPGTTSNTTPTAKNAATNRLPATIGTNRRGPETGRFVSRQPRT